MPQAINELNVDFVAQIQEIKRLISSSNDADRRTALEEQLRELEIQRIQAEQDQQQEQLAPAASRRKSFRPTSAKPRMSTLTPLAEDTEVVSSFHGLEAHHLDDTGLSLVSEVFSSSYDEAYSPENVLENGSRTLWVSSGMFPQFLRIVLREPERVAAVEITCRHVTKLQLRASSNRNVAINKMAVVGELEVSAADSGKLDTHRFALTRRSNNEAKGDDADEKENAEPVEAIQIDIESGYSDFVCVYFVRLRIGNAG
ncbi:hypothetical protein F441_04427 [Phytophthora nicotianae CJ01A1]|uniref:Uncharacterized protein n=3 Tax=Phytophthora nicotianae TaxID=4792 RepID=W2HAU7_PHYNI|nr:hypothetical protein L915_04332 [Phytophthora nicotianae]ETL45654.1 hypothetical protein L916_04295 [Phytophthora nicotianae]ETO81157.1 hypothetical protein F444_04478 [Phytophthora nicotianae P1976]ETP22207.1 hypothetical protein F441_04427 [Phytophthora nicotianae CJ01A1]